MQGSQYSYSTRAEYCDNRLRILLPYLITTVPQYLADSRPASNHISSTCIQLSTPLSAATFLTAIKNNEMYNILNVQWRGEFTVTCTTSFVWLEFAIVAAQMSRSLRQSAGSRFRFSEINTVQGLEYVVWQIYCGLPRLSLLIFVWIVLFFITIYCK